MCGVHWDLITCYHTYVQQSSASTYGVHIYGARELWDEEQFLPWKYWGEYSNVST